MPDVDHAHDHYLIVNLVNDSKVASPGGVPTSQVIAQRLANSLRIASQGPHDEFPARGRDCFRQLLGQASPRTPGQLDPKDHYGMIPCVRNSASTTSAG